MQDRKGFTLIELLIVVVIIGILAAIAIPKFSATRERAYYAAMKSDLKNLASQQEIYYASPAGNYSYSQVATDLGFVSSDGVTVTITEADGEGWAANAEHAAMAGEGCGIYYGNATNTNGNTPAGVTPSESGQIVCDA